MIEFKRFKSNSPRPDELTVTFKINGATMIRNFKNEVGGGI